MSDTLKFFNTSESMLISIMREKSKLNPLQNLIDELTAKMQEISAELESTSNKFSTVENTVVSKAEELEAFINSEKPENLDFDAAMNLIKQRVNMLKDSGLLDISNTDDEVGEESDANSSDKPQKRKRRTKAEIEAEKAAQLAAEQVTDNTGGSDDTAETGIDGESEVISEQESIEEEEASASEEVSDSNEEEVEDVHLEILEDDNEEDEMEIDFNPDDFIDAEDDESDDDVNDNFNEQSDEQDEDQISVPGFLV